MTPELLLLHFKGANGATSTSDSSPTQAPITLNGGLALSNVQSRTHCTCINIPANAQASGSYISTPILAGHPLDILSNGDFTIEGFVFVTNSTSWSTTFNPIQVFDYGNDQSGSSDATGIHLDMFSVGSTAIMGLSLGTSIPGWASLSGSLSLTPGSNISSWFHWAVQRRSGVPELYFAGTRIAIGSTATWTSYAFPSGPSTAAFGRIAANAVNTSAFFIDEIRVSNICRYSGATYTAPGFSATPFPDPIFQEYVAPVLSLADPVTNKVDLAWTIPGMNPDPLVLLWHMDSLSVADSSSYNHPTTELGLSLDSATQKFGTGALKQTSTSTFSPQYIKTQYIPGSELDIFPDVVGDFTVDGWIRQDASSSGSAYFDYGNDPAFTSFQGGFTVATGLVSGNLQVTAGNFWGTQTGALVGYTVGSWYHWAIVRKGGLLDLFLNGVSQGVSNFRAINHVYHAGSTTLNIWGGWTPVISGSTQPSSFDETRVLRGVAAYTPGVGFTPPVAPYSPPPPPPGYTMFRDTIEIGQTTPGTAVTFTDFAIFPGEVHSYQVAAQDGSDNLISAKSNAVVVSIPAAIKTVVAKFVGSAVFKAVQISRVGGIIPRIWPTKKNNTVYG